MKKKTILVISIIIIIIGGILIYRSRQKGPVYQLAKAERGDVTQIVSVTGTVTSAKEVNLEFENAGRIDEVEVSVGDRVEAGQVLIKLDTAELNAQLRSNQAALEVAKAQLAQTLAGNRPEDIKVYETDVANAEVDLKNKQEALTDVKDDADKELNQDYEDVIDILNDAYSEASDAVYKQIDPLFSSDNTDPKITFYTSNSQAKNDSEIQREIVTIEMNEFQSELAGLNINDYDGLDDAIDKAKQHLSAVRSLLLILTDALNGATSLSSSVLEGYKEDVNTARSNVNSALSDITAQEQTIATTKLDNQININDAEADVDDAEADLKSAQDKLALKKAAPLEADVDLAEAKVKQAQANVLQIQEKINKTILKAPINGFITLIEGDEGEMARMDTTIVSIIAVDFFQIEANVSETEIAKVNLDDPVQMTLDALGPDEEFSGKVIKIDPAETVVSGVIYYKITFAFDTSDERIKSGMTANLDIQTDKKESVIYLPYYTVHESNGRKYVKILSDNGDIIEKDVKIGLEGEVRVEITEGIDEGEKVIAFEED